MSKTNRVGCKTSFTLLVLLAMHTGCGGEETDPSPECGNDSSVHDSTEGLTHIQGSDDKSLRRDDLEFSAGTVGEDPFAGEESETDQFDEDADNGDVDTEPSEPEVPDNSYCQDVSNWDPEWSAWEDEVVALVNLERAAGAVCGGTEYDPAGPVVSSPHLRCASRVHSKDMVDRGYFSHTNPDNQSPWERISLAGYPYQPTGENIAAGQSSAAAVLSSWMNSPGHCSNIMNPSSNQIGVGYYPGGGYGHYWTQTFGRD